MTRGRIWHLFQLVLLGDFVFACFGGLAVELFGGELRGRMISWESLGIWWRGGGRREGTDFEIEKGFFQA